MSQHKTRFIRAIAMIAFAFIAFQGSMELLAQPTNYCRPYPPQKSGYSYIYYYCYDYYYMFFTQVTLTSQDGEVTLDHTKTYTQQCYNFYTTPQGKVTPGLSYTLRLARQTGIYGYNYYAHFTKVFIDYNQDGDFYDPGELIIRIVGASYMSNPIIDNVAFTVPDNAADGLTRMRVMSAIYYDNGTNPCMDGYVYDYPPYYFYNYYYGEANDYILSIEGGVKDTYPSKGSILRAGELYNGTVRAGINYPKPAIIFPGNPAAGTTAYYKIVGPLPSTDTIYRGQNATYTSDIFPVSTGGSSTYSIQKSIGTSSYPQPWGDGSFISNRGGEYRAIAYMINSPKPKINAFSVSWANDMQASII
ncbi:MAG: bacillolysin [Bacteroidota bacterium]|nr:bacillolysin [Bacteroidota bacterium]